MLDLVRLRSFAEVAERGTVAAAAAALDFTPPAVSQHVAKLEAVTSRTELQLACIDVANGYTEYFVDRVKHIREAFPELTIMAGNVATPEMVQELEYRKGPYYAEVGDFSSAGAAHFNTYKRLQTTTIQGTAGEDDYLRGLLIGSRPKLSDDAADVLRRVLVNSASYIMPGRH